MSDPIEVAKRAIACLDLTDLNDDCCSQDIRQLAKRGRTVAGNVAALCVWPRFVAEAKQALGTSGIRVATVVNFPGGDHPVSDVIALTQQALEDGADEIDMVIPWKLLVEGHAENVDARVARVRKAAGNTTLKAIIESGMLPDRETTELAVRGAIDGGADFIKTSTGKVPINATPEAARIILEEIKRLGADVGFKVSGGLKTTDDAATYLAMADEIMGEGWAVPDRFRFGASGVLTALIATYERRAAPEAGTGY